MQRVLEHVVRPPAQVISLVDDVGQHALEVDDGDPLGDPVLAHHLERMRPYLEVVGPHEVARDPGTELQLGPFTEIAS